jgi:HAD superfamily hydrolase (TIGR01509 family)
MAYSGVIFDFNGTLFWDTPLHNKAWNIFLKKYDLSFSDDEFFRLIHGKNNRDIFISLFQRKLTDGEIKQFINEKEGLYQELCLQTDLALAPGAEDFLDFLKNSNIPYTIATASGKENLDFFFEHLTISKWFDYDKVVYNNGEIKGKPNPEIYEIAMSVINKKPEEVVIFEDAIAGLKAAKNAQAGNIIVVNSNDDDYAKWTDYQIIKSFGEVDRNQFNA